MSFTRKMLFIWKLFSILVQNSPKVTKKVLVFRKVALSCSLTKKLLKILKVAKKLPSRIWKGLFFGEKTKSPYFDLFMYWLIKQIIIHSTHYLFSDWPKAYSEFSKSVPGTSSTCRLYNNHVKDTQGHG